MCYLIGTQDMGLPLSVTCRGHALHACIIVSIRKVYNKYSVWYLCTFENYKVTHLLKVFPRYRRIRKLTQHRQPILWADYAQCITMTLIV